LRDKTAEFDRIGAQILAVDPHESYRVRHMLRSSGFDTDDLHVPVLADPAHTVSATYGVAFQMKIHTEWANRPATFIIDKAGVIRYEKRGTAFADRPKPADILAELTKLQGR
jgi:peroxiredoxin